jgi:hypothetical protein
MQVNAIAYNEHNNTLEGILNFVFLKHNALVAMLQKLKDMILLYTEINNICDNTIFILPLVLCFVTLISKPFSCQRRI